MAKACFNQFVIYLVLSVVLFAISPKCVSAVKQYCIAVPNFSSNATLVQVTEAICQVVSCSAIRPGGNCYLPDVPYTHACWAMNLLYRHNGACDPVISQLITRDPSYLKCHYP